MPKDIDPQHEYLGDGVYASFDGWHIWLRTGSHDSEENKVALEPGVYAALVRYHDRLQKRFIDEGGEDK